MSIQTPREQEILIKQAMTQIEKLLTQMQNSGKDISQIKFKNFRKHTISVVNAINAKKASRQDDPRLRGLQEDGFKVYFEEK